MKTVKPVLPEEFIDKLQTKSNEDAVDYLAYFKPNVEQAINYVVGPFCWFIPDNRAMKIIAVSDNIRQLTPFTREEWIGQGPSFLASNAHPDDGLYLLAATMIGAEIHESQPPEKRDKIRVNIYCRMLDSNRNYRWTLVQYAGRYYNEDGRIESALGLMTDLSSFNMVNTPMITVIDNNNTEQQYFKVSIDSKELVPFGLPHISKREQEIVLLMAKGLNTPEIAAALNISYHTVENHKRNLRRKTDTKTSAELMYFVKANCLM